MADEGQGTSQASGEGAVSPPGRTRRVSSRVPTVIEGNATDVSPATDASKAPNPPPEQQVAADTPGVSLESADAPISGETPHVPPPEGPVTDAPMPVEPRGIWRQSASEEKPGDRMSATPDHTHASKDELVASPLRPKRSAGMLIAAALVIALVVAAAWIYGTEDGRAFAARYGIPGVTPTRTTTTPSAAQPTVTAARPNPTPASPMGATTAPPSTSSVGSSPPATPSSASSPSAPPISSPTATRMETSSPPPAAPATDPRFAELDRKLSALDGRVAAIGAVSQKAAPETTSALNAQDARLATLERTLNGIDKRLASIEAQLAPKAETRAAQAPDVATRENDTSAARIVVAQGLLTAVTSGTPYRAPLDALRALGAEDAGLAKLSGSAATGVPTLTDLREKFAALRPKLRSPSKSDPNASWLETVRDRVVSFVVIRPVGERTGPSAEAVSSRVDAALARGDVAAAATEARTFPAADAPVVKDWLDGASKRADAEAAARALVASSLAALAKPKS